MNTLKLECVDSKRRAELHTSSNLCGNLRGFILIVLDDQHKRLQRRHILFQGYSNVDCEDA